LTESTATHSRTSKNAYRRRMRVGMESKGAGRQEFLTDVAVRTAPSLRGREGRNTVEREGRGNSGGEGGGNWCTIFKGLTYEGNQKGRTHHDWEPLAGIAENYLRKDEPNPRKDFFTKSDQQKV